MRFARWVVFSFAIQVLVILIDKGAGVVLYKILEDHPEVKGAADLLTILPFIMMSVANLGLATSSIYFLRRKAFSIEQVVQTTSLVAVVWGSAVALVAILASQLVLPLLRPNWDFSLAYVVPICACVPFLLTTSYFNSVQLAVDRVRDYNLVHLVASAVFLPLFLALFYFAGSEVSVAIAWARLIASILVMAATLWMLRQVAHWRPRMHWRFFRAGVTYGWKANLTSVLTYLNHRVDLYLLGFLFLGANALLAPDDLRKAQLTQVGFYSMAVTFAELVWHFPEATRDLFFSKVAGSTHEEARKLTPVLCRLCLTAAAVGAVLVYFAVNPLMTLLSPEDWAEKWQGTVMYCLRILAPGAVCYTIAKILQNDLAARGHLNHCLIACALVLATMVSLDFALIPSHGDLTAMSPAESGAAGAAWASSVAYGTAAVYSLFAYRMCRGGGVLACLVVRPSDWSYVRDVLAAIREKVWSRKP